MWATELGLPLVHAGKVRELYALAEDRLLMVATDAISAYDHVLPTVIPEKGVLLTQLSLWWFEQLAGVVPHHVISSDVPAAVAGRAVVCERLEMVPVECIARGYLTGSGWAEYARTGAVAGHALPVGLQDGSRLPEPLFTPTTKAPLGEHDEGLTFVGVRERIGAGLATQLRDLTLEVYRRAHALATERGLVLADTKLEFGIRANGRVALADEVLTPDSSRFWDAATWQPGRPMAAFDKQFVRDWLVHESGWDRTSGDPPPPLPQEVVAATRARYVEAYERLTGQQFDG